MQWRGASEKRHVKKCGEVAMADGLHHRWQAFTRCVRHHRVDGRMRLKMPNAAANGKRSAGGDTVTKYAQKKNTRKAEAEAAPITFLKRILRWQALHHRSWSSKTEMSSKRNARRRKGSKPSPTQR